MKQTVNQSHGNKATNRKFNQKENQIGENNSKKNIENVYKASYQSKKILDLKEKRGISYVPIQERTLGLMKEKQ